MDTNNPDIYEEKDVTVKVERIFAGEKTAKELIVELIKKRLDTRENRL